MRLPCCAGADAERFNCSTDHTRVACSTCGRSFCLDTRDVRAEEWGSRNYVKSDGGTRRRVRALPQRSWYCSLACLNVARAGLAASQAVPAGLPGRNEA